MISYIRLNVPRAATQTQVVHHRPTNRSVVYTDSCKSPRCSKIITGQPKGAFTCTSFRLDRLDERQVSEQQLTLSCAVQSGANHSLRADSAESLVWVSRVKSNRAYDHDPLGSEERLAAPP